jgi:membrane protease YdiL (CAAX protease family)
LATSNSQVLAYSLSPTKNSTRDFLELTLGFAAIMIVLWLPTHEQLILGPIALLAPLAMVIARWPGRNELGFGVRGLIAGWWVLPATVALMIVGVVVAREAGTFHAMYAPDLSHVGGYVLWTIYQQFLLQDYFMPRLTRLLTSNGAIMAAAILFAVAHVPNIPLVIATLLWGAASCLLFRRYRNLWVIGLAQGMLGLCFAVCLPDAWHHRMHVGLGYFHYLG